LQNDGWGRAIKWAADKIWKENLKQKLPQK
jgi:hypothetical protein